MNASAGPGQWQSYDVWFRAACFDGGGNNTQNARITVFWNGQFIHNDVELQSPTGMAALHGEPVAFGATVLTGPLHLQGHGSDARGDVRFRNVWVAPLAPLAPPTYTAGSTIDLFDGETLDGWINPRSPKSPTLAGHVSKASGITSPSSPTVR